MRWASPPLLDHHHDEARRIGAFQEMAKRASRDIVGQIGHELICILPKNSVGSRNNQVAHNQLCIWELRGLSSKVSISRSSSTATTRLGMPRQFARQHTGARAKL